MTLNFARMRRLRATPALRDMLQETQVSLNDLIYPIFIEEGLDDFAPVESMPGVNRIPEKEAGAGDQANRCGRHSGGDAVRGFAP